MPKYEIALALMSFVGKLFPIVGSGRELEV
jgi:hypothetical protein